MISKPQKVLNIEHMKATRIGFHLKICNETTKGVDHWLIKVSPLQFHVFG